MISVRYNTHTLTHNTDTHTHTHTHTKVKKARNIRVKDNGRLEEETWEQIISASRVINL